MLTFVLIYNKCALDLFIAEITLGNLHGATFSSWFSVLVVCRLHSGISSRCHTFFHCSHTMDYTPSCRCILALLRSQCLFPATTLRRRNLFRCRFYGTRLIALKMPPKWSPICLPHQICSWWLDFRSSNDWTERINFYLGSNFLHATQSFISRKVSKKNRKSITSAIYILMFIGKLSHTHQCYWQTLDQSNMVNEKCLRTLQNLYVFSIDFNCFQIKIGSSKRLMSL